MAGHLRPVLVQDGSAERVDLDVTDDPHPGPLQSEGQPADTGEQIEHVHAAFTSTGKAEAPERTPGLM
ncbi:hypothetical protein O7600_17515 [Micromonospora sp. WMMA1998]|uniref:hypothetical protein n=1 Tax=Micromonospora sp. WMMA1998 TaxID=3015167 RepID=UPI00248B62B3|nr:hypothetical protein [Micromonospora sp. WMMA1998]WBC18251.1 hypothetical protein O7600_17515 [Micromonospora sp. WMMA1998]